MSKNKNKTPIAPVDKLVPYGLGHETPHPAYMGSLIDTRMHLERWAYMEDRRMPEGPFWI